MELEGCEKNNLHVHVGRTLIKNGKKILPKVMRDSDVTLQRPCINVLPILLQIIVITTSQTILQWEIMHTTTVESLLI